VIGNEARGVSEPVKALSDIRVKIPMRGRAESLNAAVAAGILMYELTRP
ncbi:MAG: 23S rRNA (guanosine(2251)-2'-O)-methyltransferase RlmB, partial [Clostridia bacterium]|nr:23S rRNA (guanosine(2251)-2'-O)-methyltransferase RlmB [Clostridia bacterium]